MKNLLIAIIVVLSLVSFSYAAEMYPSAEYTADALIKTGNGTYGGVIVFTTDNDCTVKVYDNTTNSGRVLDDGTCLATSDTCKGLFPWPISYEKGVYVDITVGGGTCTYMIFTNK